MEQLQMDIRVALVSDFYHPGVGGVEVHLMQLAKWLLGRVGKVIVVTHSREGYYGKMEVEGVTTYYLSWQLLGGVALPSFLFEYPQAKSILTQERINLVHLHQSSSGVAANYGLFAYNMGIRVIHTEHSLYQMSAVIDLLFNWIISSTFLMYDRLICVSRATRNNMILRTRLPSKMATVIPNAVNTISQRVARIDQPKEILKLAIVSRMTYRRGIDLLIQLLPTLLNRNPQIRVEVVGQGDKLAPLMKSIEDNGLSERVKHHGYLPNDQVLQLLSECDIFLSPALTESFGMALVEAASLGLHCISTRVGGTSQIMRLQHLRLVDPTPNSIIKEVELTIEDIRKGVWPPPVIEEYYPKQQCHSKILEVYEEVIQTPKKKALKPIIRRLFKQGSLPALLLLILIGCLKVMDLFLDRSRNRK